jgi:hypothetical protein
MASPALSRTVVEFGSPVPTLAFRRDHGGMFERFTDRARRVLVLAQEEARHLNHAYIGTEHILLGLLHEGQDVAAQALAACGVILEDLRDRVDRAVGRSGGGSGSPPFTPRAKKALELSLREALHVGDQFIGTGHLLLGLLREGEGLAVQVLVDSGVDLNHLRDEVTERLGSAPVEGPDTEQSPVRRCSFCGRDVDEAAHFVSAPRSVAICSDCIVEATRALESAGEEREVFLPVRIVGAIPHPEAARAIAEVIELAFASAEPLARRRAAVEDFDEHQPFLALAARTAPIVSTTVTRVRFVTATHAVVDFQTSSGRESTYRSVRVTSDGSHWYVPFDAMRTLLGELGVAVPRRPGGLDQS